MKNRLLLPTVLMLLAGTAIPLAAEEPDTLAILEKADAATRAVKACRYDAEFEGGGSLAKRVPHITGRISCRDARQGFFAKLMEKDRPAKPSIRARVTISMKPMGTEKVRHLDVAFDDNTVTFIDEDEKYWMKQSGPQAGSLMDAADQLYMIEFMHPTPFSDEIHATERKYEGVKEINGVPCDVIYVKYRQPGLEARWFFSREDSLPRRVERISSRAGVENARILTLSNLDVSPEMTFKEFQPGVPDGFERRTIVSTEKKVHLPAHRPAPKWKLKTPAGEEVSLESLRGKVVVLNFWATWCGYCKMSMPSVQAITEQYAEKPVKVLGVCCWDPQGDPARYLASMEYTFQTVINGDKIAEDYGVKGLPTYFVIDPNGQIVYASGGLLSKEDISKAIDKALLKAEK